MKTFAHAVFGLAWRVGALLVLALIGLMLANIVLRECLSVPLVWANEVSLILFVWAVFIGGGVAFAQGARIRFTIVVDKLGKRGRIGIELLLSYVGLGLLAILFGTGCYVAYLNADQQLTSLPASAAWQWAALPAGSLLAMLGWITQCPWTWSAAADQIAAPQRQLEI